MDAALWIVRSPSLPLVPFRQRTVLRYLTLSLQEDWAARARLLLSRHLEPVNQSLTASPARTTAIFNQCPKQCTPTPPICNRPFGSSSRFSSKICISGSSSSTLISTPAEPNAYRRSASRVLWPKRELIRRNGRWGAWVCAGDKWVAPSLTNSNWSSASWKGWKVQMCYWLKTIDILIMTSSYNDCVVSFVIH